MLLILGYQSIEYAIQEYVEELESLPKARIFDLFHRHYAPAVIVSNILHEILLVGSPLFIYSSMIPSNNPFIIYNLITYTVLDEDLFVESPLFIHSSFTTWQLVFPVLGWCWPSGMPTNLWNQWCYILCQCNLQSCWWEAILAYQMVLFHFCWYKCMIFYFGCNIIVLEWIVGYSLGQTASVGIAILQVLTMVNSR